MSRYAVVVFAALLAAGAAGARSRAAGNGLIVFASDRGPERGGDIRIVAARGGTSRNITQTDAQESVPVVSPGGKQIAFLSDRAGYWALYVARADGTRLRRLTGKSVRLAGPERYSRGIVWTRQGDAIAVRGAPGLFVVNVRPARAVRVTSNSTASSSDASWSSDGRRLAYTLQQYPAPALVVVTDRRGRRLWSRPGTDPQWSPRGTRIAFNGRVSESSDGDLLITNGNGRTLASFPHSSLAASAANGFLDQLPAWSPDGRWIAFVFSRSDFPIGPEVRLARAGEWTPRALGGGPAVVWAPDSRRLAFTHYAPSTFAISVQVANVRNDRQKSVADNASVVAWSPNGRRIAVADALPSRPGHHVDCGTVLTVRPDGSDLRRAVQPLPASSTTWGGWAEGGRTIVYRQESGSALYTVDPTGAALRELDADAGCGDSSPAWSPDGKRIAFSRETLPSPAVRSIYVRAAEAVDATPVGPGCCDDQWGASWSPDGAQLAYSYDFHEVVASPIGSGSLLQLFSGDDPSWSPEGDRIAFSGRYGGIWVGPASGGDATRIAEGGAPAWSPDGNWIAYTPGAGNAIRAIQPDANGDHEVHAGAAREPSWSPDGNWLVYANDGDLWIVGAEGSGNRQLTSGSATDSSPSWQPLPG